MSQRCDCIKSHFFPLLLSARARFPTPKATHTFTCKHLRAHLSCYILFSDSSRGRLAEMDGAVTTSACAHASLRDEEWLRSVFFSFLSLWYSTPFNRRPAILFPSVVFNEHTAHSFTAREGREGRRGGGRLTERKSEEMRERKWWWRGGIKEKEAELKEGEEHNLRWGLEWSSEISAVSSHEGP